MMRKAIFHRCACILAIPLFTFFLTGCSSLFQPKDQVWIRHGTNGLLEYWKSIEQASTQHWPYAWASMAAYQYDREAVLRTDIRNRHNGYHDGCFENPEKFLLSKDWIKWPEIPALGENTELGKLMAEVHLRAQVWEHPKRRQIIVAFGGTNGITDLAADLRWMELPFYIPKDQYSVLFDRFVPAFLKAFEARASTLEGAWLRSANIVATGHSLGGGLAQGFAYAASARGAKVDDVITFDPSPVSGKREVVDWRKVAKDIEIQRIYHRGEILAVLRAGFNTVLPPKPDNAAFNDIRYSSEWSFSTPLTVTGSVRSHFLRHLACTMAKKAHLDEFIPPRHNVM